MEIKIGSKIMFSFFQYIKHYFTSKHKGHSVHSPFVFNFINNILLNDGEFYCFEKIEAIRKKLLNDNRTIEITDLGAGSKIYKTNKRVISKIAKTSVISEKEAKLLFRIVNYFQPKNIIELGTSLGISTLYLANTGKQTQVFTIEGDKQIYNIAKSYFSLLEQNNIKSYNDNFDYRLPEILNELDTVDCVYIDGNHTKEASLRYFNMLLPKVTDKSILIFDDIYWNKDMLSAWNEIKANKQVKLTIDLYYFGIVLFRTEQPKEDFKLFVN